jgi:hypothetical protein
MSSFYNRTMRFSTLWLTIFLILWPEASHSAVVHVPLQSSLVLKPGQVRTITVDAAGPMEIGWQTVQENRCTMNCVQATDLTGGANYTIATPMGASMRYTPAFGKISVEYKNVSSEPVTINVYRIQRTCEAEACKFLEEGEKSHWLVFKVDEFSSITTSKDGSYSVISGVTTAGRHFTFTAVWWTDEKRAFMVNCAPFVVKYLANHVPKEQYRPYIISGQIVRESPDVVLKSIDTCAPKALNFGVPEGNVFK